MPPLSSVKFSPKPENRTSVRAAVLDGHRQGRGHWGLARRKVEKLRASQSRPARARRAGWGLSSLRPKGRCSSSWRQPRWGCVGLARCAIPTPPIPTGARTVASPVCCNRIRASLRLTDEALEPRAQRGRSPACLYPPPRCERPRRWTNRYRSPIRSFQR
jgi:hypothetical protein